MSAAQIQRAVREFDDPRLYVKKSGVGLFDSHEEEGFLPERDDKGNIVKDKDGKPKLKKVVHKFDKDTLDKIAHRCNERDAAGDFCPITIGHTLKDPQASEKDQPEPVGVARNWRTEWDEPHGKWMLKADFYIKADRFQEAKTYPRTSIELWPESLEVDPVAIIRRTPQRDCGSWVYSRGNHSYSRTTSRFVPRLGRHVTVLQYARDFSEQEKSMADMPNLEREDQAPELSHEEKVEKFAKHVFSHPHAMELAKHYAAMPGEEEDETPIGTPSATPAENEEPIQNSAQPSATNGSMPKPVERAGTGDDEVKRMQRDKEAIQFARVQKQISDMQAQVAQLLDTNKQTALQYARSEAEKVAQQLVYEGFDIDMAEEVERMVSMTPDARVKHADYVRKYHRQAPTTPTPFVGRRDSIVPPMGKTDDDTAAARHEMEVLQFQRKHKGMTYEQAEEELARRKSGANGAATRN